MFKTKKAFSGFSVSNLTKAMEFYSNILGFKIEDTGMGLNVQLPNNAFVFIYQKDNHISANFTILNFIVDNIEESVDELVKLGVKFEHYKGMNQDKRGIMRAPKNYSSSIAWFQDPSGNILSLIEDQDNKTNL